MADCRYNDAHLMDWLYQELEPVERAQLDEHVTGCAVCGQVVEHFQQVRALMRQLAEDDPPAALSAKLLHEAARHAAERERPGWWSWLVQAVRLAWAHPAAMAMATVVLVVTVGSALYVRGQDSAADLGVASQAPAPAQAESRATSAAAPPLAATPPAPVESAAPVAAAAAVDGPVRDQRAARGEHEEALPAVEADDEAGDPDMLALEGKSDAAQLGTRASKNRSAEKAGFAMGSGASGRADAPVTDTLGDGFMSKDPGDEAKRSAPAERARAGEDRKAVAQGALNRAPGASEPYAQPEQAAQAALPGDSAMDKEEQGLEAAGEYQLQPVPEMPAGKAAEPRQGAGAEVMHAKLLQAIRSRQCETAVRLASELRTEDPGYYRDHVASSKELAACQRAVASKIRQGEIRSKKAKPASGTKAAEQAAPR